MKHHSFFVITFVCVITLVMLFVGCERGSQVLSPVIEDILVSNTGDHIIDGPMPPEPEPTPELAEENE